MFRRLDVKIILTLLFTALMPWGISTYLVSEAVDTSLSVGLNEQIQSQLEGSLKIHRQYIEEIKNGHRKSLEHIIDSAALARAVESSEESEAVAALENLLKINSSILGIRLTGTEGRAIEVKGVADQLRGAHREVTREADVNIGPYTSLEMTFAVDDSITESYALAGLDMDTYQALVSAPPAYLSRRMIMAYLAIVGVIIILSITMGIFWTRRFTGRIHKLSAATVQVAAGDMDVRVDPGSPDEVGVLVESFNGMVAELSTNRSRIEYLQKISAWQEMARRLAHEIKNPLTPIHLAAQQLREKYPGGDDLFGRLLDQSTEIIEEEVATLRRLTSDFSSFARLPQIEPELVNLQEFMKDCEASMLHMAEQDDVTMVWEVPQVPIPVNVDRIMMKRVIDNLARNGVEALRNAGVKEPVLKISVTTRRRKRPEVEIRVEDNGPGIMPEHHPSIFDPYFTTKNEGTGLGLAISKKIVLEHGGRIWVDEGAGAGASFVIILPTPSATGGKG